MNRKQIIKQLRDKRYTYEQIGKLLGLTKQRIQQIHTEYIYPYLLNQKPAISISRKKLKKKAYQNQNKIKINTKGLGNITGGGFWKEIIRRRDNHTCQICGKKWKEGQRHFDTHKIDCDDNRKYNQGRDLSGWITLCHKCHLNLAEHRKAMKGSRSG